MTYSEAMAERVLELERALRDARKRVRQVEASRDLWRHRAVTYYARRRAA